MCGIAGIISKDLRSIEKLPNLLKDLHHRGPEGIAITKGDDWAIGHAHLTFSDLSDKGTQPMTSQSGRSTLAFNGEVFNYVKLGEELNTELRSSSDTEVLLELLEKKGLEAISLLNGFFGIAYVDHDAAKAYLIRDAFGVKPLYYINTGDSIAFSSEIRPLRHIRPFKPHRETAIHNLIGNWTQGLQTGVEGVLRTLPGHVVEICLKTQNINSYQWFDYSQNFDQKLSSQLASQTPKITISQLDETLTNAIALRASSIAPLAVLCSGGLDSSLTTAILHRQRPEIPAYCVDFPEHSHWSEYPFAKAVGEHLGKEIIPVKINADRWRRLFVHTVVHFEYPIWHESSIGLAAIAEDLKRDGIKGVLCGEAADELFGGYDYKYKIIREAYYRAKSLPLPQSMADPSEIVHDVLLEDLYGPYKKHQEDDSYRKMVIDLCANALKDVDTAERSLEEFLHQELFLFLNIILCRLDRSLMQYSIEGREPYLDNEIVRLAANLPLSSKTTPRSKEILRSVAKKYLPDSIIDRKKRGFSVDPSLFFKGHVNPVFLEKANLRDFLQRDQSSWKKAISELRGRSIMRVLGGEIWFRHMFLNQSIEAIEDELWL